MKIVRLSGLMAILTYRPLPLRHSNTIPNPPSLRNFGAPPEIFQEFFLMIWDNFNFPAGLGYRETVLQGWDVEVVVWAFH